MATRMQLFTENQLKLLSAVLDRIIPGEGQLPGAGEMGLGAFLEGEVSKSNGLRRLFTEGLAAIEISASREGQGQFEGLSPSAQDAVLQSVEAQYPTFFAELVLQCYNGYYTNPTILDLIGYSQPQPQEYQPRPFDENLLVAQRQREPFWRRV